MAKVSSRGIARRYAKALLSVAADGGDPKTTGEELRAFAGLLRREAALRRALEHPGFTAARKQQVLEAVAASGRLAPLTARFLVVLLEHDRLRFMDDVAAAYQEALDEHLQIARAVVTSAVTLTAPQIEALGARLGEVVGKRVVVDVRVDPAVVGGLVARVGSRVFDGSVISQLRRMKERLATV